LIPDCRSCYETEITVRLSAATSLKAPVAGSAYGPAESSGRPALDERLVRARLDGQWRPPPLVAGPWVRSVQV
jgi:hypothetical protein